MSEIPNVVPGEPVESVWGNSIRDRSITRYTDATNRDASIPVPSDGTPAWLTAPNELTIYDGADWRTYPDIDYVDAGLAGKVSKSGDTMTGDLTFSDGEGLRWVSDTTARIYSLGVGAGISYEGSLHRIYAAGSEIAIFRSPYAQFGPDAGTTTTARIHREGSQTTPLYSARSFTSTGINIPSNQLEFVTLGQRRMYIESGGGIVIENLTPLAINTVVGRSTSTGRLYEVSLVAAIANALAPIEARLDALEAP